MGQQDDKNIERIAEAYDYDKGAKDVMWKGGALYVPQLSYDRKEARRIVKGLVA